MRTGKGLLAGWIVLLIAAAPAAPAIAGPTSNPDGWVSRKEHDALLKKFEDLQSKVDGLAEKSATKEDVDAYLHDMEVEMAKIKDLTKASDEGTTKLLLVGDINTTFNNSTRGTNDSFGAGYSPLIIAQVNEHVFAEAGLDFGLHNDTNGENAGTDVNLSLAAIYMDVCDYLVVGMGRLPVPFGIFHTNFDPSWINKLPDAPLAFGDRGIAPDSAMGLIAKGAIPIKQMKLNYAAYVANGTTLLTSVNDAGTQGFDNFQDTNKSKSVGGRVGFLPIPELEVGYSIQGGQIAPNTHDGNVNALLQAIDLNYSKEFSQIKGKVTVQAEWVWSHAGTTTFGPQDDPAFAGPLTFRNNCNGGYVLVAYRPTQVKTKVLSNLEFVFRYDRLDIPGAAPGGGNEQRWTPGVVYWLAPNAAIKAAYELDQSGGQNSCAFLLQFAVGL